MQQQTQYASVTNKRGAVMRRLCLGFSFLLAALIIAPNANAQDALKLNQTYRDVIRLHFPAGKTQIPLPEGEWELLGLNDEVETGAGVIKMWRVYLARIENDTLVGQILFVVNNDLWSDGFVSSDYCDRDDLDFKEVKSNRESDVDCWALTGVRIRPKNWNEDGQKIFDTLLARNVTIPRKMILATFFRRNRDNYLDLFYYFQPYRSGKIITRKEMESWGRRWKPKVDAGFLGKLEATKR